MVRHKGYGDGEGFLMELTHRSGGPMGVYLNKSANEVGGDRQQDVPPSEDKIPWAFCREENRDFGARIGGGCGSPISRSEEDSDLIWGTGRAHRH